MGQLPARLDDKVIVGMPPPMSTGALSAELAEDLAAKVLEAVLD
jgi:hypothetical protein